jgi:hypothetical protein
MPKNNMMAVGRSDGPKKAWKNTMFIIMGNMITVASATNLPVIKAIAHSSSVIFMRGNKYTDATIPSINVLTPPFNSGCGARLKSTTIDENKNISPTNVLTIITAIFMI